MSDSHHDDHHDDGAHEIDDMPNGRLFNLLFGLSALTLLACIGVVQLFNRQLESVESSRGEKESFQLTRYREEMTKLSSTWGVVEMVEDDGLPKPKGASDEGPPTADRFHMPIAEARRRVLADPAVMAAPDAYPGWEQEVWGKNPKVEALGGAAVPADGPTRPQGPAVRPPTQGPPGARRPPGTRAPTPGGAPARVRPPAGAPKGAAPGRPAGAPPKKAPAAKADGKSPTAPGN